MTSKQQNDSRSRPEEAVRKAVKENPGVSAEGIAQQAGIAKSTARRALARQVEAGEMDRHLGGRKGGRRLPDRFTLKGVVLPAADASHVAGAREKSTRAVGKPGKPASKSAKSARPKSGKTGGRPASSSRASKRLKAGGLEPLVLAYLAEHRAGGPHGPTQVAKALGRSSGAVGNCLVRLTERKETKQVSKKPRRYGLAA